MEEHQLRSFVISSKTCHAKTREKFGYRIETHPGVYRSENPLLESIELIALNELRPAPHNLPLKCFASKREEQQKAFLTLKREPLSGVSTQLGWLLRGLEGLLFPYPGVSMSQIDELTPEYVKKLGKQWTKQILAELPPEEVLKHYKSEEVLKHYKSEEVFKHYKVEDRLKGVALEDRLKGVSLKDLKRYLEAKKKS